jgi:outer membrane protein assembly factor BamB
VLASLLVSVLAATVRGQEGAGAFEAGRDGADERETQLFALNGSREAEGLALRASEAVRTGRLTSAFAAFAELVREHGDEVLPVAFAPDLDSQYEFRRGVEPWVRSELERLDTAGRRAWSQWCEERASALLESARRLRDEDALRELAREHALSSVAARAELALGDLAASEGRLSEAQRAWNESVAAASATGDSGAAFASAARARLDALAGLAASRAAVGGDVLDEQDARLPAGPLHEWTVDLPDNPFARSRTTAAQFAFAAAAHGDRVYVSTSLEVLALDLLSGSVLWTGAQPEGWANLRSDERREFAEAIDFADAIVQPTADDRVVVAALQIPYSKTSSYDYQGITVTSRIPERRLFAYDAVTGERLWDHTPGRGLAPEAESLSVAGPPLLHEGRLYVPCARVEGRIELRVLCIDPRDGSLVWSTRVVSGQRALNMFNRHEEEFWSAPLALHDDVLLVGSQLGSVAALAASSGACLWQATYEPLPLPRNRGFYSSAPRRRVWRNAAPVVDGGVVIATPTDCEDVVAIELATGRVVWSQPNRLLEPDRSARLAVDLLLGVRDGALVFGGGWLASWRPADALSGGGRLDPAGLAVALPEESVLQASGFATGPRAALLGGRVLVPSSAGLLVHDLAGERLVDEELEWRSDVQGNVLATRGALVCVRADRVSGFLDIGVLETRTRERLSLDPSDRAALETAGRILLRRSELALAAGDDDAALEHHVELRELLAPHLETSSVLRALDAQSARDAARVLVEQGRLVWAAEVLEQAARVAREPQVVLDLLLELHALERERDPLRAHAVLAEIDRRAAGAEVGLEWLARDEAFLAWLGPATPRALPADLWTATQRGLAADASDDAAAAVAAWQAALEEHGSSEIAVGLRARIQFELSIARWLIRAPDAYEPYEVLAGEALERARAAHDVAALDELVRRHPFAAAAGVARELVVDWALEGGDLGTAIDRGRAAGAHGDVWTLERRAALALLADASGNGSFARSLLDWIARNHPSWRAEREPVRGLGAREIGEILRSRGDATAPLSAFGEGVRLVDTWRGPLDLVGLVADPDAGSRLLVHRRGQLEALPFASGLVEQRVPIALGTRFPSELQRSLVPEAMVWSSSGRLHATDPTTGRERWSWPPDEGGADGRTYQIVQESSAGEGVAVATVYRVPQPSAVLAFELVSGRVLWELDTPIGVRWMRPLVADGRAVFVSQGIDGPSRVLSVDLFTGGERVEFALGAALDARDVERFAVRAGRLIVPLFDEGAIEAFDLATGERAWRNDFATGGTRARLHAVVEHGASLFAVSTSSDVASGGSSVVHEIEVRLGGTRAIAQLDPGEVLVGVPSRAWRTVDSPHLFTLWHDGTSPEARLSSIALPLGRRWTQSLRLTDGALSDPSRTLPAVGAGVVAVLWGTVDPDSGRDDNPRLGFFDLESGIKITHRLLPQDFADFDEVELRGYGESLWILCTSVDEDRERIEVWR